MSDLDRLLQQVEELKRLASRPDDTWMDNMSNEELQALGKRVRKVADGLSNMQAQLTKGAAPATRAPLRPAAAAGSLGSVVKRDNPARPAAGWTPPQAAQPARPAARSMFPNQAPGPDLSNPMARRRVGGGSVPPEVPPAAKAPFRPNFPTPGKPAGETPRSRNRGKPSF